MDKETKQKVMRLAGKIFYGHCARYDRLVLKAIIENPGMTAEQLSIHHFKLRYNKHIPKIHNDGISQRYIDAVKSVTK